MGDGSTAGDQAYAALGLADDVDLVGHGFLRSALPVSELTALSFVALAGSLRRLLRAADLGDHPAIVYRDRSDTWFGRHIRPDGWALPSPWDPLSATFRTRDGWIRTHANAPRHRAALCRVLGVTEDVEGERLAAGIATWRGRELEDAILDAGGAAAALRSAAEWAGSEAGGAVRREPLIASEPGSRGTLSSRWRPTGSVPLRGIRVLDLTRVIAGPACTQVLAGLGADVLRVDPPDWEEPAVLPLVMGNKRSVRLDAKSESGAARLSHLLSGADILVHGYRAGAIEHLGLDAATRERLRPGLVEVSERAYGWSGPWASRRGFDSLVQFSTGIADRGRDPAGVGEPASLPVQALDWATGYLAAASAIAGLVELVSSGLGSTWHLSLARTAYALLDDIEAIPEGRAAAEESFPHRVGTARGDLMLAEPPFEVGAARLAFDRMPMQLGLDAPEWA